MDNPRFNQLLDLAREGDEASVAQLWHEFGFDFPAEVFPSASPRLCEEPLIRVNRCSSVVKNSPAEGGASC